MPISQTANRSARRTQVKDRKLRVTKSPYIVFSSAKETMKLWREFLDQITEQRQAKAMPSLSTFDTQLKIALFFFRVTGVKFRGLILSARN